MNTLRSAAVLPSKDSPCRPPLRLTGDKIYHAITWPWRASDDRSMFNSSESSWKLCLCSAEARREWPEQVSNDGQATRLGIGSVCLVRRKTWGLLALPARPSGPPCGAGGSPRPGQCGMHVRRPCHPTYVAGLGGWLVVVVARMHGATHAPAVSSLSPRWLAGQVGDAPALHAV